MANQNQKGGKLEGGALTDEVMESASNLTTVGGHNKGLQQFYAPEPVARFAADVCGRMAALDLTAGDGSLLKHFGEGKRFGVEIDKDQIANSGKSYHSIQGDVQHVAPLLEEVQAHFPVLALNPPFGLKWSDPSINEGAETNSSVITLHYAARLLDDTGAGFLLTGGDGGFDAAIKEAFEQIPASDPGGYYEKRLVPWAVISVPDIWQETRVGNDIVLFGWFRTRYGAVPEPRRYERAMADLNDPTFLESLKRVRQEASIQYRGYDYSHDSKEREMWFRAVQSEYDRRARKRQQPRKSDFDVWAAGGQLVVKPRPFVNLKLAGSHALQSVKHLHKQPLTYFALNTKRWEELVTMEEQGTILIEPSLKPRVEALIEATKLELTPLTQLKPQQRLAYLEDIEKILCTKTDADKGFEEGEEYPISVRPIKRTERQRNRPAKDKDGTPILADFEVQKWMLEIRIKGQRFEEVKDDIEYLVEHFAIPDPGTVDDQYPELIAEANVILDEIESEMVRPGGKLKAFQRQHLARLIVKKRGLLAHEQGLGKTLQGITYAKAMVKLGARDTVLIVTPQDLIPQWQAEAKSWYGQELTWLRNQRDFRQARDHIKAGGTGWYITHYEALSRTGKKESLVPLELKVGQTVKVVPASSERVWNAEKGVYDTINHEEQRWIEPITRGGTCPRCGSSYRAGYNPSGECKGRMPANDAYDPETGELAQTDLSSICGWTPYDERVKPCYNFIKSTFRKGVLVIDELTKIKGDYSQVSLAVRGIKAKYVLGMTGTPIKNYAPDAYWGLWKCLGNATPRFPFNYTDGQEEFISQFTTLEWRLDSYGRRKNRKKLPEISNISKMWKLLAPNVCRLRKEECGEPLVERTFYPTLVPCGVTQRRVTELWLTKFGDFFKELYPDHPIVQKGLQDFMAPMLGMQPKLEYAATMPEADPHKGYWVEKGKIEGVSNWTPKNTRVLELAMHHAAQGDKVLIGSALKAPGKWLHDELIQRGVKAINILAKTEDEDELKTMSPAQRAKVVREFQAGDAQVLVSSHALNLGHNLDKGNVVILTGLPWDYATFDQFIARVHRLTSERGVRVYVVLAKGTLDERKWKLLVDKGSAANLALDGRLIEEVEEHINEAEIIRQMVEAGIPVDGTEVVEDELEEAWRKIESADDLPELVLEGSTVTDLADLKTEEEDEGDEVPDDPDSEAEPDEDEDSDGLPEGDDSPDEAAVEEAWIGVSGRGSRSTLLSYLYEGHNEIDFCHEYPAAGGIVAIIRSDRHPGFGARPQADRLMSGAFAAVPFDTHKEAWESIQALGGMWSERETKAQSLADEAIAASKAAEAEAEAQVEPEIEVPHTPVTDEELAKLPVLDLEEFDAAMAEADEEVAESTTDSVPSPEPDPVVTEALDQIEDNDPEPVAVGAPDDDYLAGF